MTNQTYVECLTPIGEARQACPLILVHGGGQSGMVSPARTMTGRMLLECRFRTGSKHQTAGKAGLRTFSIRIIEYT